MLGARGNRLIPIITIHAETLGGTICKMFAIGCKYVAEINNVEQIHKGSKRRFEFVRLQGGNLQ